MISLSLIALVGIIAIMVWLYMYCNKQNKREMYFSAITGVLVYYTFYIFISPTIAGALSQFPGLSTLTGNSVFVAILLAFAALISATLMYIVLKGSLAKISSLKDFKIYVLVLMTLLAMMALVPSGVGIILYSFSGFEQLNTYTFAQAVMELGTPTVKIILQGGYLLVIMTAASVASLKKSEAPFVLTISLVVVALFTMIVSFVDSVLPSIISQGDGTTGIVKLSYSVSQALIYILLFAGLIAISYLIFNEITKKPSDDNTESNDDNETSTETQKAVAPTKKATTAKTTTTAKAPAKKATTKAPAKKSTTAKTPAKKSTTTKKATTKAPAKKSTTTKKTTTAKAPAKKTTAAKKAAPAKKATTAKKTTTTKK